MKQTRRDLLNELRDIINKNDNANVTFQQVEFYIGDEMKEECIKNWVLETHAKCNPVTAYEVLYKWNHGYTFHA